MRARRGRSDAPRPTRRSSCRLAYAPRRRCMPQALFVSFDLTGGGDSAEDDGEVLPAYLFGRERSAWLIPADRHPGGVADEPVHQVDVDVLTERAVGDALLQDVQPHLALFTVALVDKAELRYRRQPLGLVLVDHHLRVPVLDR